MAAHRFYLSTAAAPVSVTKESGWSGSSFLTGLLRNYKGTTSTTTSSAISLSGTNATILLQWVSDGIAAQTISGLTVKMQLLLKESSAAANIDRVQICLRVVSNDGTTVRGTLFSRTTYTTNNELDDTGLRNRMVLDGDAVSSVTAQDGDRLVLEVGVRTLTIGSFTAQFQYGENATDLPEDETTTSGASWLEFSSPIVMQALTVSPGNVDATADPTQATETFGAATVTVGNVDSSAVAVQPGLALGPVTLQPAQGITSVLGIATVSQPGLLLGPATATIGSATANADITGPIITTTAEYTPPDAEARYFGGAKAVDPSTHPVLNPELARVYFLKTGSTPGYLSLVSAQKLPITQLGYGHLAIFNGSDGDCDLKDSAGNVLATIPWERSAKVSLVSKAVPQGVWLVEIGTELF